MCNSSASTNTSTYTVNSKSSIHISWFYYIGSQLNNNFKIFRKDLERIETVLSRLDPVSNLQLISLFTPPTRTRQNCLVLSAVVFTAPTRQDKTVLSCPCRRCEQAIATHIAVLVEPSRRVRTSEVSLPHTGSRNMASDIDQTTAIAFARRFVTLVQSLLHFKGLVFRMSNINGRNYLTYAGAWRVRNCRTRTTIFNWTR